MKTQALPIARYAFLPFAILLLALMCAAPALAKDGGFVTGTPQGFSGPGPNLVTVKEVMNMSDDTKVFLRGNIIQRLGGEDYLFQDATGAISVEIDDKRWNGQNITPQDTVEIFGEVEKGWTKTEIDVKTITKVNK